MDADPLDLSAVISTVNQSRAGGPGVLLRVKVVPGASRSRVAGLLGDRLKVTVAAPATGGQANDAVCLLIAAALGVAARRVAIVDGHGRPQKTLLVEGVGVHEVSVRLREHLS